MPAALIDSIAGALVPAAIACFGWRGCAADLARNAGLIILAGGACALMAVPPVQPLLHFWGQPAGEVVVVPVFIALYPLLGRFNLPDPWAAYCGTFASLFVADVAAALVSSLDYTPWWVPFTWIGGNGLVDGLVVLPVAAAALMAYVRWALRRGYPIRVLFGRNRYLRGA